MPRGTEGQTHQKKSQSRETSGQKKECLTGNNLVPKAAGALLISPGWKKKKWFY